MMKLIIRADDFGFSEAVNHGILKAMQEGIAAYIDEVRKGAFPAPEHEFKISDQVMEKLYAEGGCAK